MKKYKIVDVLVQQSVIDAVKHYGIEGTEEAIKRVYSQHKKLKETMLNAWKQIYIERR